MQPNIRGVSFSHPKTYTVDLSRLDGGLNLWELDYRLKPNQSPNMLNMYWLDGALCSRKGQAYMYETPLGAIVASYERTFKGFGIFHAGTLLYKMDMATGVATSLTLTVPTTGGTFFEFGDSLYYKTVGAYVKISSSLVASDVVGYTPIITINAAPDGTGSSAYQSENRISKYKESHFTSNGTDTIYQLPIKALDSETPTITVNGVAVTSGFTYSAVNGTVTFTTAPTQSSPPVLNNVKIKFAKTDTTAYNSVMGCPYATTYGGDTNVCVVVGGGTVQPNAYYWSGSNLTIDPTYFPADYYNLAGQSTESITGFGKQQGLLVLFKEHSVGKVTFGLSTIVGSDFISMNYTNINTAIGCDLPKTIQLVLNNLVFANSYGGVYILLDTSQANENNIMGLSRNINGAIEATGRTGLLYDIKQSATKSLVSSVDDTTRYWIVASGNAYVWDYTLSPFTGDDSTLSWFKFDNIAANTWISTADEIFHGGVTGLWTKMVSSYDDYGQPINKVFEFAVQSLGSFDRLKDVTKVIFVTRTDTNTLMDVWYKTDYGTRQDDTPIVSMSYKLVPRDLKFRILEVVKYAKRNVRMPRALHIGQFSMSLTNNTVGNSMSLISAQIEYKYTEVDR